MFRNKNLWVIMGIVIIGGVAIAGCTDGGNDRIGGGPGRRTEEVATAGFEGGFGRVGVQSTGTISQELTVPRTVDPLPVGRNSVAEESGLPLSLQGQVVESGDEWYLQAAGGKYLLGLGPVSYRESIGMALSEGDHVAVRGTVTDDELAVATLETKGQLFTFRTEDGIALWSGRYSRATGGYRTDPGVNNEAQQATEVRGGGGSGSRGRPAAGGRGRSS